MATFIFVNAAAKSIRKFGRLLRCHSLTLAVVLLPATASAHLLYGERSSVLASIEGTHGETPHVYGLTSRGSVGEFYANDESRTWSFIVTDTDGRTCLMAVGEGFEILPPKPKGDPS